MCACMWMCCVQTQSVDADEGSWRVGVQMRCVRTRISVKKEKRKKKKLSWVRMCWHMDALHVLADADGGWGYGRIACGWMRGRRRKEKKNLGWRWWTQVGGSADALRVRMDAYERKKKERKKEQKNLLWDFQGCARGGTGMQIIALACGRGCVACGCGWV